MTTGWRVVAALGRQETVRLTRHPLILSGAILATALSMESLREHNPLYDYQGLTMNQSFVMGPMILIAANLITRRELRAGTRQLIAATPVTERRRLAGLLCAAAGPALLTAVLIMLTATLYRLLGADPVWWPDITEYAVQPVRLLGAGLLGVMIARWLADPIRPALLACVVAVAMIVVSRSDNAMLRTALSALFVFNDLHAKAFDVGWHVGYLLCLDAMAAIGALLATPGPRRALCAVGAVSVAGAVFTGWAQL